MKLIFLLLFIAFCSLQAFSQTAAEEITQLREQLGVGEQTKITPATDKTLKFSTAGIKVFIATGLDMKIHDNFVNWIEKWNRSSDAKKFGTVEVTSDLNRADVALARYTLNAQARSNTASYPAAAMVYDPATNSMITRPTQRTYSYSTVPVFAYVLRRNGADFEILSRYSDSASVGEHKHSGEDLWKDFEKLLKESRK